MIVTNRRGDVLLELIRGAETELIGSETCRPLTHALVIAKHHGKFLFILNRWKKSWELPGGMIEPGEAPRACAERELQEETGQILKELRFAGLMRFQLQPDARIEYGALYAGDLDQVSELRPTEEAESVILWDLETDIGIVDEIDRALVDFWA